MRWENVTSEEEARRVFEIITPSSTRAFPEASSTEGPLVIVDSWVFGCFMDL